MGSIPITSTTEKRIGAKRPILFSVVELFADIEPTPPRKTKGVLSSKDGGMNVRQSKTSDNQLFLAQSGNGC